MQNKSIQQQEEEQLPKEEIDILQDRLEKLQQNKVETYPSYQGAPEKAKTPEEIAKEKKEIIEKIKELEEDYYHPEQKMSDEEFDKIEQSLINHPLFIKDIPENIDDNPGLQAMQSMIYDDTPENIAIYAQKKGNELFKKGQDVPYYINEAFKTYTEGIDAKGSDPEINSKLLNNRALIQIKKKNYGKAIEDCKEAIKQQPKFVKAYFRMAQAQNFLQKYKEAVDTLLRAQQIDQKNKEIQTLLKQCQEKLNKSIINVQAKKDIQNTEQTKLNNALKIRNIYLGKAIMEFPDNVNKCCWQDEEGTLHFPSFIQYPEFQQMDYIQDINENHILQDHIKQLFGEEGLPYDINKKYNAENVEVYIELNQIQPFYDIKDIKSWPRQRGIFKIDPKKKMSTIMATRGFVLPCVAEFYIVCPENKEFYNHFKKNFEFVEKQ